MALAAEGSLHVNAEAIVETHTRFAALVYVIVAVFSLEARWAGTVVLVIPINTTGSIGTGTGGTGINTGAVLTWVLITCLVQTKLLTLTWSF